VTASRYRDLGEAGWAWVLEQVRDDDGPWLPESVTAEPTDGPGADRDSLYAGIAGLVPVLAEIRCARPWTTAEHALAEAVSTRLGAQAGTRCEPSLYFGLAGDLTSLHLLSAGSEQVALQRLTDLAAPRGWLTTLDLEPGSRDPANDVVLGTAGVVLAAAWVGGDQGLALAETGCEAMLRAADRTEAGLDWTMWPGRQSRGPNYSHGTAGVATALAVAGHRLGRDDLVAAAVLGARHLLAVGSLDDGGFVVPHTIPPSTRDVEPVTYTWCHGPTGTSHLFSALHLAGVTSIPAPNGAAAAAHDVTDLHRRCLHSVLTSGLPQRLRPGFWDNDGRCCGTAGVGDMLLDAAQDAAVRTSADDDRYRASNLLETACLMADALVERALHIDDAGERAYWRFVEYRQDPPLLPPGTSWMQGAAGIAAFLLRLARVLDDGLDAVVIDRPDQWWAVPAELRLTGQGTMRPVS
jgi:Lanthionine synthetase C-like protein